MVSLGSGVQPAEPLGNIDLLNTNLFTLLELGKKAQSLLSLLVACVCVIVNVCEISVRGCYITKQSLVDCNRP